MTKQSSNDWSTSSEFEDLSSRITSEKEILALFEKMMVSVEALFYKSNLMPLSREMLEFSMLLLADCWMVHVFCLAKNMNKINKSVSPNTAVLGHEPETWTVLGSPRFRSCWGVMIKVDVFVSQYDIFNTKMSVP